LAVHDRTALLDAWAEAYDLRRNPFIIYRTWLAVEEIEARLRDRGGESYALTLWSGMRHLMGEAERPKTVALFWSDEMAAAEELLQLSRRGAPSYVFVFQPYDESLLWGAAANKAGLRVVHPLQLCLDLGSGDEHEMALAQRVREALLPY
jgi:predicted N-formylglutamate amidohydrolase